jgi:hypothetical protein
MVIVPLWPVQVAEEHAAKEAAPMEEEMIDEWGTEVGVKVEGSEKEIMYVSSAP